MCFVRKFLSKEWGARTGRISLFQDNSPLMREIVFCVNVERLKGTQFVPNLVLNTALIFFRKPCKGNWCLVLAHIPSQVVFLTALTTA